MNLNWVKTSAVFEFNFRNGRKVSMSKSIITMVMEEYTCLVQHAKLCVVFVIIWSQNEKKHIQNWIHWSAIHFTLMAYGDEKAITTKCTNNK